MFYEIDTLQRILTIDLVGPFELDRLKDLVGRIQQDARYNPSMDTLYDISRCDFTDTITPHIRRLAAILDSTPSETKLAIYAPDDLSYGLARIYISEASLLAERDRRVFKDYRAAYAWLVTREE